MLIVSVLEKIKNKEILNTRFYESDWKPDETSGIPVRAQSHENHKRFDLYCAICDAVGDGYLQGEKSNIENSHHYDNLQLTKKGGKYLKLMKTPINDILKPSFFEVIIKSTIGRLVALLLVPIIIYSFNFLFPEFSSFILSHINTALSFIKSRFLS